MLIDDYSNFTDQVWKEPVNATTTFEQELAICALGLAGETGEVVEKIKKLLHYGKQIDSEEMEKELGDVIYYWTRIVKLCGFWPSEILEANVEKLTSRKSRGVLHGIGSNR